MDYDLFISYSRHDNKQGQVTSLKNKIESSFYEFAGINLRIFIDIHEILSMEDWQQKIQQSLRMSQMFLAVLTPNYLNSRICSWEWEDYVRYEAMRQCLREGIAPVYFITLPDATDPRTDVNTIRWLQEIQRRQTFDLRSWFDSGEKVLKQDYVKKTLKSLNKSIHIRLKRADLASKSPNNLIKHNPAFVGRINELSMLRNALAKNNVGVVGALIGQMPKCATVQGLGGMGKTELALAYAHAFAWDYPGGRWHVPCENVSDLRVALLYLANANALDFDFSEDELKNITLAFERVLRELKKRERCLIIFDNVSDPNLFQPEHIDRLPNTIHVDIIATTRLAPRAIPGSAREHSFIAVDELPEEDALALLRSHQPEGRFSTQQEDFEARNIVRLLCGFTLAVETAAIYLGRDQEPDPCRRFRERLSPDLLRESEDAASDSAVTVRHRVRSLEETLTFTLQMLTPEAQHLLEIAALLPADHIAVPWLKAVSTEKFQTLNHEHETSDNLFFNALELLLGFRLFQTTIVENNSGVSNEVRMHRLVQEIVAKRAGSTQEHLLKTVVSYVEARCQNISKEWVDRKNRWEIEPLRAFAEQLLIFGHSRATYIANEVAVPLKNLSRYTEAEDLYRAALTLENKYNYRLGVSLHINLSTLLHKTNRLDEAENILRDALTIAERNGPDHPDVAIVLSNFSQLLVETDRLKEAEELIRHALSIDERHFGAIHPTVAIDLNNLAKVLSGSNRIKESVKLYRRALSIDEQTLGKFHPNVANRLYNLACVLEDIDVVPEAEVLHRRALAIRENLFDREHPDVAHSLNSIARLLQNRSQVSAAEQYYREALAILEKNFGPDHPDVALCANNIASLLQRANRLDEAEVFYKRSLKIYEQAFNENHSRVALALNNIATLLMYKKRADEAKCMLKRAVSILENSSGADFFELAHILNNLASVSQDTGQLHEAEELYRRALEIRRQFLGPNHVLVAISLNNLASLLENLRMYEDAIVLYQDAMKILELFEIKNGYSHPDHQTIQENYKRLKKRTLKRHRLI